MATHDIIAIGASAGGIEAVKTIASRLPADLPAAVFVVIHVATGSVSVLPQIISRAGPLGARHPAHGEEVRPGVIYVAPPDHHLMVRDGRVRLGRGPRENRCRPAADPLFRSAARDYGSRVVGVVLSGNLDDGTAGMVTIKRYGGVTVVQDPAEAPYPGMPSSALANVPGGVDHAIPVAEIGPLLAELSRRPAGPAVAHRDDRLDMELSIAEFGMDQHHKAGGGEPAPRLGEASGYGCPECGGALFQLVDGKLVRYRCRTGHAYSPESLLSQQAEGVEAAFWAALRALEETASLSREIVERARKRGTAAERALGDRFRRRAEDAERHARVLRSLLTDPASAETNGPIGSPSVSVVPRLLPRFPALDQEQA